MKKIGVFTIMVCLMMILVGCSSHEVESESYHKITVKEAKKMMDEQDVMIVDVRTEEEYKAQHIEKAVLVPNETIAEEASQKLPDKSKTYLVYCRSGSRSLAASKELVKQGYEAVYDFGGIKDWPYEVVSEHE